MALKLHQSRDKLRRLMRLCSGYPVCSIQHSWWAVQQVAFQDLELVFLNPLQQNQIQTCDRNHFIKQLFSTDGFLALTQKITLNVFDVTVNDMCHNEVPCCDHITITSSYLNSLSVKVWQIDQ